MDGYTLEFKQGTRIWNLYQALRERGIGDSQLDQGYYETDFVNSKRNLVHKADKVIQEEEVLEYALERYEKYRSVIQEKMGYELPWLLSDYNPATSFDYEIRKKIKDAIAAFKIELEKEGYKPTEDKYKELLATSLFCFVMGSKGENLKGINEYIDKNGGLDVAKIKYDCFREASALQTLKLKCGACTEKSAILYSALKMAGLDVSFIYALNEGFMKVMGSERGGHVSVGLTLSNRVMIIDPFFGPDAANNSYDKEYPFWYQTSLREFLSSYYTNLGSSYNSKHKFDKAAQEFKKAIELDPNHDIAHYNLGNVYYAKYEYEKAIEELSKALEINPNYVKAHYYIGNSLFGLGNELVNRGEIEEGWEKWKEAIAELEEFLKSVPNHAKTLKRLKTIKTFQKELQLDHPELK